MNNRIFLILPFVLAILACSLTLPTIESTPIPATQTGGNAPKIKIMTRSTVPPEITITGTVYVRNAPNGQVVGYLEAGKRVAGVCIDDWCKIDAGYIWRGCTSEAGDKGCEVKP